MIEFWLTTMWLFLPALVANQCPGFVANFNKVVTMPWHSPVSVRWLGESKTWSAYYAGPIGGCLTAVIQATIVSMPERFWLAGILMGAGAVLGDHAKSCFKRYLGISSGKPFWPLDQTDFVFGMYVLSVPLVHWGPLQVATIVLSMLVVHPIGNFIGMKLGLRKTWW